MERLQGMTNPIDNILGAIEALQANRLRTVLSLLGIIIGVAAVIMVGAAASSGKAIIFKELETFGLKSLWVYRSFYDNQPGKTIRPGSGIKNDDLEAIRRNSRFIKRLTPIHNEWNLWAKYMDNYIKVKYLAVSPDYAEINNDSVSMGRFIVSDDMEMRRKVCVIGTKVVDKLFPGSNPLGKEIRIENDKYTVIGVLQKKDRDFLSSIGSIGGEDPNDRVIVPVSTYQHQHNTEFVGHIQAEAISIDSARNAAEEIKTILHNRHKDQYLYESQTMQQYIETVNSITRAVSWIGSMAAIISLVVGGIGIMNIMTVSVVERTREIGLMKALGACRSDILTQFLAESVFISLLGGVIGTGIGSGLILVIQIVSHKPRLLALEYLVIALAVSILTGIFSGLYPARRAASLDPVEALRHE